MCRSNSLSRTLQQGHEGEGLCCKSHSMKLVEDRGTSWWMTCWMDFPRVTIAAAKLFSFFFFFFVVPLISTRLNTLLIDSTLNRSFDNSFNSRKHLCFYWVLLFFDPLSTVLAVQVHSPSTHILPHIIVSFSFYPLVNTHLATTPDNIFVVFGCSSWVPTNSSFIFSTTLVSPPWPFGSSASTSFKAYLPTSSPPRFFLLSLSPHYEKRFFSKHLAFGIHRNHSFSTSIASTWAPEPEILPQSRNSSLMVSVTCSYHSPVWRKS